MLVANPITFDGRVLRHAETLAAVGHAVTVVGVLGPRDVAAPLPANLPFRALRLVRQPRGIVPRLYWATSALRQRLALRLCAGLPGAGAGVDDEGARTGGAAALCALAVATSAPELAAAAALLRCDVVHCNDLSTLPAGAWAARLHGRYVYDAHELYVDEHPSLSATERRARARTEGHYIRGASAVLTVNALIADELQARYGVRAPTVLRNLPPRCTVTPPDARPPGAPGRLRLLYQGAHLGLEQHGTDDVLRAMARLRDRLDVTLTLRGGITPEARSELARRVGALGLGERVRVCPPVSGAEALVHAAVADGAEIGLAVHPPLCQSYRLTTSSKVYEYQAAGLGVVATDLIGNRLSIAPEAGAFYTAGDDAGLAAILLALGQDPARRRAMQRAAFSLAARELCWEMEKEKLLAVYRRLEAEAVHR